nr:Ribonucleoside-diphosphate reductase 1 subunit beta [Candidatus Pantoea persica]
MTYRSSAGDLLSSLVDTLQARSQLADVLIVNGGLGPTSDDLQPLARAAQNNNGTVHFYSWKSLKSSSPTSESI